MTPAQRVFAPNIINNTVPLPGIEDHMMIRGRRLPLNGLICQDLEDAALLATHQARFCAAEPFEHIVIDGLFDERLLDLLNEEFDAPDWRRVESPQETHYRSTAAKALGSATQVYLNLVNSAAFTGYLSTISGIANLITDHTGYGGGLHETRAGGRFGIHRDFNYHRHNLLANQLVMITYLNRDWQESYGGALELWDKNRKACVTSVLPLFGRTIIFRHSERSFHGHPTPLAPPPSRTRRSIAAYYYINEHSDVIMPFWRTSTFMDRTLTRQQKTKMVFRNMVPPALWMAARYLKRCMRGGAQTR
jgi:Rps23 Pro-64 3,4-dihydroxylase Tpa1-like proline 4-hydroxylase